MRAGRIPIPDTAFSVERVGKHKRPRNESKDHLAFIRTLSCAVCGSKAKIQAAHIRARSTQFKKRQAGMSEKPDDKWTVPLCEAHHLSGDDAQHKGNEIRWWAIQKIDPFVLALALYACRGDRDEAEGILSQSRSKQWARSS